MPKFNNRWVVQPHGPLDQLDTGLWSVEGEIVMPLGRFPRRMTVIALSDGRLAVWSPIPLDEARMAELDSFGRVAFLIAPGVGHRLDLRSWATRYPRAKLLSPSGAREAVSMAVPVAATSDIMGDPEVGFVTVPGTGGKEGALLVRRDGRFSLVVNDIVANVHHPRGIGAQVMARLGGFGVRRPRMPRAVRKMFVKDGRQLAAQLRNWAADPELTRIVVSHGDTVIHDPAGVLERVAAKLN